MTLGEIYNKVARLSPRIEILLRQYYWRNIRWLSKYRPKRQSVKKVKPNHTSDFGLVLDYLRNNGVGKGSLLVVHPSYDALAATGLSPNQIIDALLDLIGEDGTLAMPVIRQFKEDPPLEEMLTKNMEDVVSVYNVRTSLIITGMLPYVLMRKKGSITSRFPLNPLTAYGPLATRMMEHNLDGNNQPPHGTNSSWKFCVDNNAVIVGLGLESGFLSITHVFEENHVDWPVSDWYRERSFKIIDGEFNTTKKILERKPIWGLLYFPEKNVHRDLVKNKILKEKSVDGIQVAIYQSKDLMDFFSKKFEQKRGYPYHLAKKMVD